MKEWIGYANKYMEKMNIADVALLKACVFSLGMLAGAGIPKPHRKKAMVTAGIVFACTYGPLMTKFFRVVLGEAKRQRELA